MRRPAAFGLSLLATLSVTVSAARAQGEAAPIPEDGPDEAPEDAPDGENPP